MTSMFRALHAELLKLKRTLAFRVIFVLPFLVALLQFFIVWRTKKFARRVQLVANVAYELTANLGRVHDAAPDRPRDRAAQRHRA